MARGRMARARGVVLPTRRDNLAEVPRIAFSKRIVDLRTSGAPQAPIQQRAAPQHRLGSNHGGGMGTRYYHHAVAPREAGFFPGLVPGAVLASTLNFLNWSSLTLAVGH